MRGALVSLPETIVTPRAVFFIDGFNLYNGLYKGPRGQHPTCPPTTKWLDMSALAVHLAPGYDVTLVKLFTAQVLNNKRDPHQVARQRVLWAALGTRSAPPIEITRGRFTVVQKRGYIIDPKTSGATNGAFVEIETYEEKGTDVNLAAHLVAGAFQQQFDAAFVISNDSDLAGAISIVQQAAGIPVHVLNPTRRSPSGTLTHVAASTAQLTALDVAAHQMPDPVVRRDGLKIHCPPEWT